MSEEEKPQPYIKSIRPTKFMTYLENDVERIVAQNILYNNNTNRNDRNYNPNIDEVFYIIYKSGNNKNIFKQYLCEILDGKHYYNIFNTNFFIDFENINLSFIIRPFIPNKVYVPFFFIIALLIFLHNNAFYKNIVINLINASVYFPKIQEIINNKNEKFKKGKIYAVPTETNFYKDFTRIINIFKEIFENQSNVIMKGTTHTNREIVENIIYGCLLYVPYVTDKEILLTSLTSPIMFTLKIENDSNIFKKISVEANGEISKIIKNLLKEQEEQEEPKKLLKKKRRQDNPNESLQPSRKPQPQKSLPRKPSPIPQSPSPSPPSPPSSQTRRKSLSSPSPSSQTRRKSQSSPSPSSQTRRKSQSSPRQTVEGQIAVVSFIPPKKKTFYKKVKKIFKNIPNFFTRKKIPNSSK